MMGHYLLNSSGEPYPVEDVFEWAHGMENSRILKQDRVGDLFVSTVFLGIDHRFIGDGPPILWETMVFRGSDGFDEERYTSQAAALVGHEVMLGKVRNGIIK